MCNHGPTRSLPQLITTSYDTATIQPQHGQHPKVRLSQKLHELLIRLQCLYWNDTWCSHQGQKQSSLHCRFLRPSPRAGTAKESMVFTRGGSFSTKTWGGTAQSLRNTPVHPRTCEYPISCCCKCLRVAKLASFSGWSSKPSTASASAAAFIALTTVSTDCPPFFQIAPSSKYIAIPARGSCSKTNHTHTTILAFKGKGWQGIPEAIPFVQILGKGENNLAT